ncbi:patatin-like phospholipase family protein [Roseibium sp. RKSG952]|uniref:patatin-like phospholipase family protein n=1 Tax=Roseibium sp. RKSG952 TaxID=2529384 RepID=UPI0012BD3888|nr:patatin-like phospholipase family protein [Roseibium sp. RKSG952]MTI00606.1 patatin-like phospholipase family protein [Roseibium sp. RKSG952]
MSGPKIGLALGGGGARGMSHIPVLEAFDDLGLRPSAIAGASIGAIIGSAYASGKTGSEIKQIAIETFADRNSVLGRMWKLRPKRFQELFTGDPVQFDPLKVLEVFVGDHLPADFDMLEIPMTVLVTDFYACAEIDINAGALHPAVAASIAIPAIFRPVKLNDRVMVDGGVANPLPFDRLPSDCDFVVAVDVVGKPVPRSGRNIPTRMDAIFGSTQILMQSIMQEKLKRRRPDILLQPIKDSIGVLDFMKTEEIISKAEPLRDIAKRKIDHALSVLERKKLPSPEYQ